MLTPHRGQGGNLKSSRATNPPGIIEKIPIITARNKESDYKERHVSPLNKLLTKLPRAVPPFSCQLKLSLVFWYLTKNRLIYH